MFLAQSPASQRQVLSDAKAVTPVSNDQSRNTYLQPFGMYYNQDSTSKFTGFSAIATGFTFGIDEVINDNWIVGWGGSYMHSWMDFDSSFGNGEIDSFRTGPYASYFDDRFHIDAALDFGYHLNKTERDVVFGGINRTAEADYDSYDFSAYLGSGYDINFEKWTLTPMASAQYISYRNKSFRETGADAAGLDVDANTQESLLTRLGVNLKTQTQIDSMLIVPELFVGYAHEFIDEEDITSRLLGGTSKFTTNVESERQDSFFFGGSLTGNLNKNTSTFIRYEGEIYSGNKSHVLTGGLMFLF